MGTIALALGAGGARGLAHIHALKAFDDLGIKPVAVAGTSMGSLMGAAYCSGLSGDDIEAHIEERLEDRMRLIGEVFKIRPASFESFFADGGFRFGELNLETILSVFLPERTCEDFADLSIPLKVVATDYYGEADGIFQTGPLRPAVAASAAIPAVFLPVKIAGRYYFDGSATNPCPLDTLQESADHVVAVDVSGGTRGEEQIKPSKVDAIYGANQLMQRSIILSKAAHYPGTPILRPPVDGYRPLDFLKAREILTKTQALREDTKRQIERLLEEPGHAPV